MNAHSLEFALARIAELETALAAREQELADIRAAMFAPITFPLGVRLQRRESAICRTLMKASPAFVNRLRLFCAVYDLEDQGRIDDRIVESHVSHLRRKLTAYGVRIVTHRYSGYSMPRDSSHRLRAMIEGEARA